MDKHLLADASSHSQNDVMTGIRSQRAVGGRGTVNVGRPERLVSTGLGALLALRGMSQGRLLLATVGGSLLYRGVTGHCYAYDILGLDSAEHPDATVIPAQLGGKVEASVTINRPADELFAFWRDLENMPRIMRHLKRVDVLSKDRSRWIAEAPLGREVAWDAQIVEEREGEMLAWKSLPDSDLDSAGSVHFKALENDRGTVVKVSLKYNPPGGRLGEMIAFLSGQGMNHEITEDLRNFKRLMENGQMSTL